MNIKVLNYDEETGRVDLDLDDEAQQYILEVGMNTILTRAINEMEEKNEVSE